MYDWKFQPSTPGVRPGTRGSGGATAVTIPIEATGTGLILSELRLAREVCIGSAGDGDSCLTFCMQIDLERRSTKAAPVVGSDGRLYAGRISSNLPPYTSSLNKKKIDANFYIGRYPRNRQLGPIERNTCLVRIAT